MNIEKAILIMRNELECVKEADKCDRHCEDCSLAMEAEDIIECYEWVIKELKKKRQLQLIDRPAEYNLFRRYDIIDGSWIILDQVKNEDK